MSEHVAPYACKLHVCLKVTLLHRSGTGTGAGCFIVIIIRQKHMRGWP
jgi:hypothetical protein